MIKSYEFLKLVIDTITESIVVINDEGDILFVNYSWRRFAKNNSCLINNTWEGVNYLKECDRSAEMGDELARKVAQGIRKVITSESGLFHCEYPCHSTDEKRWFMMRVTPFSMQNINCFVISHQNITERKLAEEEVLNLSRIDSLTDISNRRHFDEFLNNEWKLSARLQIPISLALIDIDHFKLINDTYGHLAGDECLKKVGRVLKQAVNRPNDICARYGGEEFAIVYGNTTLEQSRVLIDKLFEAINALNIPNENSPTLPRLTVSIGLETMYPNDKNTENELIKASDTLLYMAKENGRNQVAISTS